MANDDKTKYNTPLTLGEFRRLTAHLPDSTLIFERANSAVRVVMVADASFNTERGIDQELLSELDMEPTDLQIPEGTEPDEVCVITFAAWD